MALPTLTTLTTAAPEGNSFVANAGGYHQFAVTAPTDGNFNGAVCALQKQRPDGTWFSTNTYSAEICPLLALGQGMVYRWALTTAGTGATINIEAGGITG